MKIKVVSDLHLEFGGIELENNGCDVLVLSGDVVVADLLDRYPRDLVPTAQLLNNPHTHLNTAQTMWQFLDRVSAEFEHVVYVAGNHEFYGGTWNRSLRTLWEACEQYPNLHFLERDIVEIDGVVFVGGTLWTSMNGEDPLTLHAVRDMMNDFRVISHDGLGYTKLRPAHTVDRHYLTLEYISHVVSENKNTPYVVVTHHAPSSQSLHPQYKSEHVMNGAFYTDLSEFVLDHPQIKLWTHGHMHNSSDYNIGSTRVVCNPRGYGKHSEYTGFNPQHIITL